MLNTVFMKRKHLRKTKDKTDFMTKRDMVVRRQEANHKSLMKDDSRGSLEAFLYLTERKLPNQLQDGRSALVYNTQFSAGYK